VSKLSPDGSTLIYSTYLGGSSREQGPRIAIDDIGNAYVTSWVYSFDFPVFPQTGPNAVIQPNHAGGGDDIVLAKLSVDGSALVYSTYLGASGNDEAYGIAVDASGNAYVAGHSSSTNFYTTPGAFQTTNAGKFDFILAKVNANATAYLYSTYFGGSLDELGFGGVAIVAIDASGDAYISGFTNSTNLPISPGAYKSVKSGGSSGIDIFVAKITPAGNGSADLIYSTLLGGSGGTLGLRDESSRSITVDAAGNAYVTGNTVSTNFDITAGAFQTTYGGGNGDAFVTMLNATGTALLYSTYLGGSGTASSEMGRDICVDVAGHIYVTGHTPSTDFPITPDATQGTFGGGNNDGFVTKLNPAGNGSSDLVFSTFLGGSANDAGAGLVLDASGNAYVTGFTSSTDFNTTTGAFQTTFGGGPNDAFVTKISIEPEYIIDLGYASSFAILAGGDIIANDPINAIGNVGAIGSVSGNVSASDTIFPSSDPKVQQAIADLDSTKNIIENIPSTAISGNLGGQTLGEGVYDITGAALLSGTLMLSGDTSSIYVFIIEDSLVVETGAILDYRNVFPQKIYWLVKKSVLLGEGISFSGIIISSGNIISKSRNAGFLSLFTTNGSINLHNGDPANYLYLYSKIKLQNRTFPILCGTDVVARLHAQKNPSIQKQRNEQNALIRKIIEGGYVKSKYVIPVVFHVIYDPTYAPSNISDEQIFNAIDVLNKEFNDICVASITGESMDISFCLATTDLSGNPLPGPTTPGIIRIGDAVLSSHDQVFDQPQLKSASFYPSGNYLNIWVVREITQFGFAGPIGYATYPGGDPALQGVVVKYDYVGNTANLSGCIPVCPSSCTLNVSAEGELLVHEVGHYLGLYHTFESTASCTSETDCNTQGDLVCDTPPHPNGAYGNKNCNTPDCSGTQMVENYMDYTPESCRNAITEGQRLRAHASVNIFRQTLVFPSNLSATGVQCVDNVIGNFSVNLTQICVNSNAILNAVYVSPTAVYDWDFGDSFTQSLTGINTTNHTYTTPGNYTISLIVTDGSNTATEQTTVFVIDCISISSTQGRWFFGQYAGLDFQTGLPLADPGAYNAVPQTINSPEAVVTQSDNTGQLLFYSDGQSVWNNSHALVNPSNPLSGHNSSSQAIVVTDPGNPNQYYLFYIDALNLTSNFYYQIIAVTGGIVSLSGSEVNISLPSGSDGVSEQITAIPNCGNDYWIIVRDRNTSNNKFLVYNLNSTNLVFDHADASDLPEVWEGWLQASPEGSKLALGNHAPDGKLIICDFNKITGVISNPVQLNHSGILGAYGVSFSPNSKYLYAAVDLFNTVSILKQIVRFDITKFDPNMTSTVISTDIARYRALQLGPDNKIYIAKEQNDNLAVINYPDNTGNPGFNFYGIPLKTAPTQVINAMNGLPNMIDAKTLADLPSIDFAFTISNCIDVKFDGPQCYTSYDWNFDLTGVGGASANTSTDEDPATISYSPAVLPVTYTIQLSLSGPGGSGTVTHDITFNDAPTLSITSADEICPIADGSADLTVTGGTAPFKYQWSNGQTTEDIKATADTYSVIVTDINECTATSSVIINRIITISLPASSFTFTPAGVDICTGEQIDFTNTSTGNTELSYLWDFDYSNNPGVHTSTEQNPPFIYNAPGYYQVVLKVTDFCGQFHNSYQVIHVIPCVSWVYNYQGCSNTAYYDYENYTVTGQEVWDLGICQLPPYSPIIIKGTLRIKTGASLTISGRTVEFGIDGKVIIERGGLLHLKEGSSYHDLCPPAFYPVLSTILTGLTQCGTMWQGVEVWGDGFQSQTPAEQGKIIINSSSITKAHIGVLLGRRKPLCFQQPPPYCPDPPCPLILACKKIQLLTSFGGGIIEINATFVHPQFNQNAVSLKFTPYTFQDNISIIDNCDFTGGILPDPGYTISGDYEYDNATIDGIPKYHVYNWRTRDVKFYDNTFTNAETGIESHDASNMVGDVGQGNTFDDLKYGFRAFNITNSLYSVQEIKYNIFLDIEEEGIRNTSGQAGEFHNNWFQNPYGNQQSDYLTGIYFENSSGFFITDNNFDYIVDGISVNNSGMNGGIITDLIDSDLGNEFTRCNRSMVAWQNNPELQITCNTFNPEPGDYYLNWQSWGNLRNQGYPDKGTLDDTRPAGNKFDPDEWDPSFALKDISHFVLCPAPPLTCPVEYRYYRHTWYTDCGLCIEPDPTSTSIMVIDNNVNYIPDQSCHLCLECRTQQFLDDREAEITALETEYASVQANLDGGNTQALLNAINSTIPYGKLKNLLVNNSLLSDDVLMALINRTAQLPPGHFKQVMVRNSPVSNIVAARLYPKLDDLPPGIASQIMDVQGFNPDFRTLTTISGNIETARGQRQMALNGIIIDKLKSDSMDVVITLLEDENTAEADRILFGTYLTTGDLSAASAKLSAMTANTQEEQDWIDLQNIILQLKLTTDTNTVFEIDDVMEQFIRGLAYQLPESPATSNAKSILRLVFGDEFPIIQPTEPSLKMAAGNNSDDLRQTKQDSSEKLTVYKQIHFGQNYPDPFNSVTYI
ncbi:MAG: SBBP repeat-containing protein, partial [Bacteroidota bacterium]